MPALAAVPKVLRLTLRQSSLDADGDIINRIFLRYSGTAPTDADLVTMAGVVATNWASYMAAIYVTNMHLIDTLLEDLTSATGATGFATSDVPGAITNPPLSSGVATVIQLKISRRYRGGHPRVYLASGGADDLSSQDQWSSDYLAACTSAWGDFTGAVFTDGWSGAGTIDHVNVSYYAGYTNHTFPSGRVRPIPTPRGTPLIDPVIAFSVNPRPASQRRRNLQGS